MEHSPFFSRVAFKSLPSLVIELWETTNFDRPGTSTEAQAFCIMMEATGSRLAPAS